MLKTRKEGGRGKKKGRTVVEEGRRVGRRQREKKRKKGMENKGRQGSRQREGGEEGRSRVVTQKLAVSWPSELCSPAPHTSPSLSIERTSSSIFFMSAQRVGKEGGGHKESTMNIGKNESSHGGLL